MRHTIVFSYVESSPGDAKDANVTIDSDVTGNVYGGYNKGTGTATNNTVTISGGTVKGEVYGGYSRKTATGNVVKISGGTMTGGVYGGYGDGSGTIDKNEVNISGGTMNNRVYGGYSSNGAATGNIVTISGGAVNNNVYGGSSTAGAVTENIVTISGDATVSGHIYGGYTTNGNVTFNTVNILGGTVSQYVYGGIATGGGTVENNTVNISGGTVNEFVYGGMNFEGDVTSNTVNILDGTVQKAVYGGQSRGTGTAEKNKVNISGGTVTGNVYGGNSINGNITGNIVTISGDTTTRDVYGGHSTNGTANKNVVNISGGTVRVNVAGGYSVGTSNATENIVNISGGTVNGEVYGGGSATGNATSNTVTIKGNPIFGNAAIIYGGHTSGGSGDVLTGNKLEVYRSTNATGTHNIKGVQNFAAMNFYLGNTTKNGDVMLQVADPVDLSKTDIGVDLVAGEKPTLVVGDKFSLINSAAGVTAPKSTTVYAGLEKVYGLAFDLTSNALGTTVNKSLEAVVEKSEDNKKVRSLPTAQMTGQSMLRMGSDTVAGEGMTAAMTSVEMGTEASDGSAPVSNTTETIDDKNGSTHYEKNQIGEIDTTKTLPNKNAVFATIGGGTSKYKAGGTSDVQGFNLVAGMAWRINQPKNNNLLLGAFFESGWGDYTTTNDFADGSVRSDGKSDYMGGGILAATNLLAELM